MTAGVGQVMNDTRAPGDIQADRPAEPPLLAALTRLAGLQREVVDRLALQEAAAAAAEQRDPVRALSVVAGHLQLRGARWRDEPDAADLPALLFDQQGRWGILRGCNAAGQWVSEWQDGAEQRWQEVATDTLTDQRIATLRLLPPYRSSSSPVLSLVLGEIARHRVLLLEALAGGVLLSLLGVLTSFYSMQVYDRVIPTGATQTLLVLTLGILVAIALEYFARRVRSRLYEQLIDGVDQRLARAVYMRFLAIRLDQLPASVGSLASQLRGYESVRAFLVGLTTHVLVDAPFALLFALLIWVIAGPLVVIPLCFLVVSIALGLWHMGRIRQLTQRSHAAAMMKTGLLVETVEGAEIIKSGQGGWRMLNRWLASTDDSRDVDLQTRHISESAQYSAAAMQQVSYVLLIAAGALMAASGEITQGALIACSILSGRVLTPVSQLSAQLIGWGNAKAALQGLDGLWRLEGDHHGQEQPVMLESLRGDYRIEQATISMRGRLALKVPQLVIRPGERVAVLGPIGAGKTTLLRLLSGMYKPQEGRIWLDDVDLANLAKPFLAEHIGYLPQEGRLLAGTLRDNLTLGLMDPGDEVVLAAAKTTGLFESVVAVHPKGLQQEIAEGGIGLSGGQRQLVNLTRVFLRKPRIWLLDEPTASLDRQLEHRLIGALKDALAAGDSMVLVTHKPEMLSLVDRIIVVSGHQIVLDGPRDAVLARLQAGAAQVAGVAAREDARPTDERTARPALASAA